MARPIADFLKTYIAISGIFVVFGIIIAAVAHAAYLAVIMLVFLWGGFAYILAAILAWTGFANLYRYSPTLFIGSQSYRRQIVRGDLWKEGRDDGALLIGLAFGVALMAVGAALWNPLFVVVDAVAVMLAAVVLHFRRGGHPAKG